MTVRRVAKQAFNTEKAERHGGSRRVIVIARTATLLAMTLVRGPRWLSAFSVLNACLPSLAKAPRDV